MVQTLQRVVFKSIERGDELKLDAKSNIEQTGGGARDFRFPYRPFEPVIVKMFPKVVQETRRRDKKPTLVDIRYATLTWIDDNGQPQQMEIKYEPPTSARPAEGRIPTVHKIPPLAVKNLPPKSQGDRFVLFAQDSSQTLAVHYVSHTALLNSNPPWHRLLRETVVEALKKKQGENSALGWGDFKTGRSYVHE